MSPKFQMMMTLMLVTICILVTSYDRRLSRMFRLLVSMKCLRPISICSTRDRNCAMTTLHSSFLAFHRVHSCYWR